MFIGRKKELNLLNDMYQQKGFNMVVLYGRRRIGKSTLIGEFIKDKNAIFYTASKVGSRRNLELFSKQVIEILDKSYKDADFATVESLFDFVTDKWPKDKTILVIDELPYWVENDKSILSVLQKYIDTKWQDKNMMIILCGSALSFMENEVLSEKSPLFGRRDTQIKLEPFDYIESAKFVPNYSNEDKAITYAVTGGVAKYLSLFNPEASLDDNLIKLFFTTGGYLFDETRNLLVQEFSDTVLANNIIEQIASGENMLNVIADKVHQKDNKVLYILGKLINVGIVEKRHCILEEKNKKKTQYVLKDTMFKFWYEFIPSAVSVIEIGAGETYYKQVVKPNLHQYMGKIFEEMCKYYTLGKGVKGEYGAMLTKVGSWWGTETLEDCGSKKVQTADVDVVGISNTEKTLVIGECKFRNEKMDKKVLEILERRGKVLSRNYTVSKYLLFSLGGFSDWYDEIDKNDVIRLTLEDLYAEADD